MVISSAVNNSPAIQETQVQSLGQEDPLGKEMATHFNILAWEIPWTEEPGGLQSMVSQRVGHSLVTKEQQQHFNGGILGITQGDGRTDLSVHPVLLPKAVMANITNTVV